MVPSIVSDTAHPSRQRVMFDIGYEFEFPDHRCD